MERLKAFTSRFFWHLYATYAILVLLTAIPGAIFMSRHLGESLKAKEVEALEEKLSLLVPLARGFLDTEGSGNVAEELAELSGSSGMRITLALADGSVLVDTSSTADSPSGNIQLRPEILQALGEKRGLSEDDSFIHVAAAVRDGMAVGDETHGFVRVSLSLTELRSEHSSFSVGVILSMWIGVVLALFVGLQTGKWMTDPVLETKQVAEAIRHGDYGRRVHLLPRNEIGLLGDTLNRLCVELIERIATISHDQAQLRAMLSGMIEGVLAVDDDGKVLFCNEAASELIGVRDVRGQRIEDVAGILDVIHLVTSARDDNTTVRGEVHLTDLGRERALEIQATPFADQDFRGVVLVLHDVTHVRRLESIRRDFVANVSHELKTPLTSVRGYVETLLGGAIKDQTNNVRFLKKIEFHVDRLSHIVVDLLSLARIESQQDSLELVPVDWQPIIHEALREREKQIEEKNLKISVDQLDGTLSVLGDSDGLEHIVDNLLDNAVKYTPEGGTICVRLSRDETFARVEVDDTGIGIPTTDLENIFQRFYRVDKARSRELGGTGLGLAIVKHLVQAMNGEIDVRSQDGKGSCFTVKLPLA